VTQAKYVQSIIAVALMNLSEQLDAYSVNTLHHWQLDIQMERDRRATIQLRLFDIEGQNIVHESFTFDPLVLRHFSVERIIDADACLHPKRPPEAQSNRARD
jgi:hypothetical protein